eukprot:CAMPEP_0115269470 /NCGR_PEP_ID=MMETSP0270-20121206/53060_1 /TAXON_ID=71861 /ORGANISM="Scrippsiella trochoidea, Strain CCMP3099" /LENGTH=53 /DNA_ID=CAMNT_0002685719 /DNA_START=10 /DNA_END=171 /DNA_ORIENTATION=+
MLQILAGIRTVKVAGAAAGEHVVSGLCHDISMTLLTNQVARPEGQGHVGVRGV